MGAARTVTGAIVLSAGLGTRLRPLSAWLAKPMMPVGDRPALAHVLDRVRLVGDVPVVVNVHHRPDDVRVFAERERLVVSEERDLLGTAGGLAHAAPSLGEGGVLVWNGDIVGQLDPRSLVRAHGTFGGDATLAVVPRPSGEGNVGFTNDGRIVRLRREVFGEETHGGDFTGIHVVGASFRRALPTKGCLVGDLYLPMLARGASIHAFCTETNFSDIGTIATYLQANRDWLGVRTEWISPTARVSASVEGCIVGDNAVVTAPLVDCVVWPNTEVHVPHRSSVLTPGGEVTT